MEGFHFYTFVDTLVRYHGSVTITDNGYIGDTPLEDYGDYLLSPIYLSYEKAWEQWINHAN